MSVAVRCALSALLATVAVAPVAATPPQPASRPRQADSEAAHRYFTDLVLVDHDGRPQRLYSDLLRDKVVVVSSFFTSCTDSCPIIMGKLTRIQDAFGDRLGRDVHMLSLTVDPATDTPTRMKEYATRLGTRPGWYLLSGEPVNVRLALRKLGQAAKTKEAHLNILIIGNERTGLWKKAMALAAPDELVRLVQGVLEDR